MPNDTNTRAEWPQFIAWAGSKGYDTAHTYDTERSRWVALNPMTADIWAAWQASRAPAAPGGEPVAVVHRNEAGQVRLMRPDGSPFDMFSHIGARLYSGAPPSDAGQRAALTDEQVERIFAVFQGWQSATYSWQAGAPGETLRNMEKAKAAHDAECKRRIRAAISESEGSSNADR